MLWRAALISADFSLPGFDRFSGWAAAGHGWRSPEWPISAKQTGRRQHVLAMEGQAHVRSMSALPPKADIRTGPRYGRCRSSSSLGWWPRSAAPRLWSAALPRVISESFQCSLNLQHIAPLLAGLVRR